MSASSSEHSGDEREFSSSPELSSAEHEEMEYESQDAEEQENSEEESNQPGDDGSDAEGQEKSAREQDTHPTTHRARGLAPTKPTSVSGILYVSRLPPNMRPHHLRQYLRDMGPLLRVYCAPEPEEKTTARAKKGGNKRRQFTEAWVEFARRKDAKNAALLLNGRPMGGKNKRAAFYYDLWNVKYLKGFTWDHLTDDLKKRKRLQERKLQAQISQAKREAQAYLEQREQARVVDKIEERRAKKQRREEKLREQQEGASVSASAASASTEAKSTQESAAAQSDRERPFRAKQQLDDSFLAKFLGSAKGKDKEKEPERRGMKRARED